VVKPGLICLWLIDMIFFSQAISWIGARSLVSCAMHCLNTMNQTVATFTSVVIALRVSRPSWQRVRIVNYINDNYRYRSLPIFRVNRSRCRIHCILYCWTAVVSDDWIVELERVCQQGHYVEDTGLVRNRRPGDCRGSHVQQLQGFQDNPELGGTSWGTAAIGQVFRWSK